MSESGRHPDMQPSSRPVESTPAAHSTAAERTAAHASVAAHTKFLVTLVLKRADVGPITGALARDLRVVDLLSTVDLNTMWDTRVPGAFPE